MRLVIFFLLILASTPVFAQSFDSEHKAWSVFTIRQSGNNVCYITSSPTTKTGNYKKRGEPYILVTYRDKNTSEVSVSSGYPYKLEKDVELRINDKSGYKLFTSGETPKIAWAKDSAEDRAIVKKMVRGTELTVKGFSKLGTYSKDTYSLMGFTKAYRRMKTLCGK